MKGKKITELREENTSQAQRIRELEEENALLKEKKKSKRERKLQSKEIRKNFKLAVEKEIEEKKTKNLIPFVIEDDAKKVIKIRDKVIEQSISFPLFLGIGIFLQSYFDLPTFFSILIDASIGWKLGDLLISSSQFLYYKRKYRNTPLFKEHYQKIKMQDLSDKVNRLLERDDIKDFVERERRKKSVEYSRMKYRRQQESDFLKLENKIKRLELDNQRMIKTITSDMYKMDSSPRNRSRRITKKVLK